MAQYRRSGHYRASPNGGYHWVSEHDVNKTQAARALGYARDVSGPSSYPGVPKALSYDESLTAGLFKVISLLAPNATCPRCGAKVYFYSNSFGSKVYFDAIGHPWPKHPCMASARAVSGTSSSEIRAARESLGHLFQEALGPAASGKYENPADEPTALKIIGVREIPEGRILDVLFLPDETTLIRCQVPTLPRFKVGDLGVLQRGHIHTMDTQEGLDMPEPRGVVAEYLEELDVPGSISQRGEGSSKIESAPVPPRPAHPNIMADLLELAATNAMCDNCESPVHVISAPNEEVLLFDSLGSGWPLHFCSEQRLNFRETTEEEIEYGRKFLDKALNERWAERGRRSFSGESVGGGLFRIAELQTKEGRVHLDMEALSGPKRLVRTDIGMEWPVWPGNVVVLFAGAIFATPAGKWADGDHVEKVPAGRLHFNSSLGQQETPVSSEPQPSLEVSETQKPLPSVTPPKDETTAGHAVASASTIRSVQQALSDSASATSSVAAADLPIEAVEEFPTSPSEEPTAARLKSQKRRSGFWNWYGRR